MMEITAEQIDQKLDQGFAEFEHKFDQKLDQRFAEFEHKFDQKLDQRFAEFEHKFDQKLAEMQRSFVTWVVSLFLGTAILLTGLGSLYVNILLSSQ